MGMRSPRLPQASSRPRCSWSETRRSTAPASTHSSASLSGDQVDLSWTAPAGSLPAYGYDVTVLAWSSVYGQYATRGRPLYIGNLGNRAAVAADAGQYLCLQHPRLGQRTGATSPAPPGAGDSRSAGQTCARLPSRSEAPGGFFAPRAACKLGKSHSDAPVPTCAPRHTFPLRVSATIRMIANLPAGRRTPAFTGPSAPAAGTRLTKYETRRHPRQTGEFSCL